VRAARDEMHFLAACSELRTKVAADTAGAHHCNFHFFSN